jgi:hypothetical protein
MDVPQHHPATAVLMKLHLVQDASFDGDFGFGVLDIDVPKLEIIHLWVHCLVCLIFIVLDGGDVGNPLIGQYFPTGETANRDDHRTPCY